MKSFTKFVPALLTAGVLGLAASASASVTPAAPGKYSGLFSGESNESRGLLTLKVTQPSNLAQPKKFSGKLAIDGNVVSISGKFDTNGHYATNIVSRAKFGKEDLFIEIGSGYGSVFYYIYGFHEESIYGSADLYNEGLPYSGPSRYTVILEGSNNDKLRGLSEIPIGPGYPTGHGFALVTVKPNGVLKAVGRTADDQKFSQSVPVSSYGKWPFFAGLYPQKELTTNSANPSKVSNLKVSHGSVWAWNDVGYSTPARGGSYGETISGNLEWYKDCESGATNYYPYGFNICTYVTGTAFYAPPANQRVVCLPDGQGLIELSEGNLSWCGIEDTFLLTEANKISVSSIEYKLKFGVTTKTGALKGSFFHPETPLKPTKFLGVVLQDFDPEDFDYDTDLSCDFIGGGNFLGTTEAGKVELLEYNEGR